MNPLFEKIDGAIAADSEAAIQQLKEHLAEYATYFE